MSDTTTAVTVTIPTAPPSKLFPNQQTKQGSWHLRSRLRKEYREIAYYAARGMVSIAGPVEMRLHVAYVAPRRLPDLEATIYGCKALTDGVVDAGVLEDDDQIRCIIATHERLPKGETEYTRMTFRAMEDA